MRTGERTTGTTVEPTREGGTSWRLAAESQYDPGGPTDLTTTIISTIAEAKGVDATAVRAPRLYDCVDVTALAAVLWRDGDRKRPSGEARVRFHYADFLVSVRRKGHVAVYEPGDGDAGDS
ncbi:HalOD1 output domain-containing protein [Halobacteriales archaeon Cl-PHB]